MTTPDSRTETGIREAVRADLLAVFRIEKRSFEQPWPYIAFEGLLGSPAFLVAEDGDSIVGYVVGDAVDTHGVTLGHIKDIAVAPEYRQRGIGRELLTHAITALTARGVGRIKLEVRRSNDKAQSLYAEFGFRNHHTIPNYYDDGEDAYVLVRKL